MCVFLTVRTKFYSVFGGVLLRNREADCMNKVISLKLNSQYQKLYRKGTSAVCPSLVMYVGRNGRQYCRLGITAGKKLGCAVVRNRAKRRLRELYREKLPELKSGYDFVLVARGRTADTDYSRLTADFITAAKKCGVLSE